MAVAHLAAPPNTSAVFEGVGATNRAGETEHFEVFYDRSLGETGRQAGAIVLNRAERDLETIQDWFGASKPQTRFVVILSRLGEEARTYHTPTPGPVETIFCDVQTTPRLEAFQSCFFVAFQLADLLAISVGWDDAAAGALARVLAAALYPRRIAGFATARHWLESDREDVWTGPLPLDPEATGSAVLFFNYLHHQLGFSWHSIATTPATTLAEVARLLTGSNEECSTLRSLLDQCLPPGRPTKLFNDNPFPLVVRPATAVRPRRWIRGSEEQAHQPEVGRSSSVPAHRHVGLPRTASLRTTFREVPVCGGPPEPTSCSRSLFDRNRPRERRRMRTRCRGGSVQIRAYRSGRQCRDGVRLGLSSRI